MIGIIVCSFLRRECLRPAGQLRDVFAVAMYSPGQHGLVLLLHSGGFPFEDVAQPIPDMPPHAGIDRAGSF
ncbi:hypothetical protein AU184_14535 [Mycolicibacterium novocastrense]|nr:hypothetical protein AU183_10850 [Mycolicibacterium novocastrense]KUH78191.1 hypothetical protein AU072_09615 [Mycolicibacterium novocastrense]KUH79526.1 hypothetical protein AU184_14535 [Mycolicibacterium novocastrense]